MSKTHAIRRLRGSALMIVLVVVMIVSLGAYTFSELMFTHNETATLSSQNIQAKWLVDAGIDVARVHLLQPHEQRMSAGGDFDNPTVFQAVNVITDPDPNMTGNFTLIAPNLDSDGYTAGFRFGLEDESSRLNLNALTLADKYATDGGREMLMALPGMTVDIADAIMDWIDDDDETREFGAEFDYYQSLGSPYEPNNGPFNTVEELLLVRGVMPELLFGADINRNGTIDSHEEPARQRVQELVSMANTSTGDEVLNTGSLDRGWSAYLTLHSQENNLNINGEPRIDINSADLQTLHQDLSAVFDPAVANFIILYRQGYELVDEPQTDGIPQPASAVEIDFLRESERDFTQVLDLVGKRLLYEPDLLDEEPIDILPAYPLDISLANTIDLLMDNASTSSNPTIPGRLNINQAPRLLLQGVPGLSDEMIDFIIQTRSIDPYQDQQNYYRHETWLLKQSGITFLLGGTPFTLENMKALQPFICGGGSVFRAQIIGYYEGGTASARGEVVIDATTVTPRIRLWRDLSHLGRGYPLDVLGLHYAGGNQTALPSVQ
ncbi:type II secretion system protein GspK [Pirellulaceae bacterium]|jgi:DNA uptake protein ComE-like DNA-binding protein|nr:type II secretion system protein GspK [Pirellulaceae bacterium]